MTGVVLSSNITFIGHEHKSFDKYILDKRLIDVGSSGCVKNDITFYTILDTNKMEISKKFIKFDREAFVNSFKNIEYPEKEEIGKIFFGIEQVINMSKYNKLWQYISANKKDKYILSYDEIESILGFSIDHSFLTYKKELINYGYEVSKISIKNKQVIIERKGKNE